MGKESWLHALSCVVRPDPNENKNTKKTRKLQLLFWKHKSQDPSEEAETAIANPAPPSPKPDVELVSSEEARTSAVNEDAINDHSSANDSEDNQDSHDDCSVALASAPLSPVKSKEEVAAFKIQSVFRRYMASRSFQDKKGSMRLKTLVRGQSVKRQATTTLKCMQTMARVQHQVSARRIRISQENQAFQRQLQQKHDLDKSKQTMGDTWNDSRQSKEQLEAKRQIQQQAAIKRERILAYADTHQTWRNSPKQETQTLMDTQWDWNWAEKWMATRPWENKTMEELNSEPPSAKSVTTLAQKVRRDLNLDHVKSSASPRKQTRTPGRLPVSSPGTPRSRKSSLEGRVRVPNSPRRSFSSGDDDDAYGRLSVSSPRPSRTPKYSSAGKGRVPNSHRRSVSSGDDDDAYGRLSVFSPRTTTKSASAGRLKMPNSPRTSVSSVEDDDKSVRLGRHRRQASFPEAPSFMTRTNSGKEKSRSGMVKSGTPEKDSMGSAKKRLSLPGPPSDVV